MRILSALVLALSVSFTASAQQASTKIDLAPGEIFEIALDPQVKQGQVSWIMTKDGNFLLAGRERTFRMRLIEQGTYSLEAKLEGAGASPIQEVFMIDVRPSLTMSPTSLGPLVAINSQTTLLQLKPINGKKGLTMDFSPSLDADGNGVANDDDELRGTFFRSNGTQINLWMPQGTSSRILRVHALGGTQDQVIGAASQKPVSQTTPTPAPSPISNSGEIEIEKLGNGTVSLSVSDPSRFSNKSTLSFWDFGDGSQSLLDSPIYQYSRSGQFTVSLRVVDLTDGANLVSAKSSVSIDLGSSSVPVEDEPKDQEESGQGASSGLVWKILKFLIKTVVIGGISLGVGMLIMLLVKKLRGGKSISATLEEAEKKVTGEKEFVDQTPPPMEVPEEEQSEPTPAPIETEAEVVDEGSGVRGQGSEPEVSEPPATSQPPASDSTPDWLQSGLDQAAASGQTQTTPAPEPLYSTPEPPPAHPAYEPTDTTPPPPAPAPEPELPPPPPPNGDLPDWLAAPAAEPTPPSSPNPNPIPASETPPPPPAESTPVQEPAPPPIEPPQEPAPIVEPPAPPTAPEATPSTEPVVTEPPFEPSPVPEASEEAPKAELTEEERERKREKRRRYRKNKRERELREKGETGDQALEQEHVIPPAANSPGDGGSSVKGQPEPAPEEPNATPEEPIAFIQSEEIIPEPPAPPAEPPADVSPETDEGSSPIPPLQPGDLPPQ